jgi:hypothetical protein
MDSSVDSATQAALGAWKRESEFNHHLAGFLVLLAGLLILADGSIRQRWAVGRHVWPICFLVSGVFLLIFSDTELWRAALVVRTDASQGSLAAQGIRGLIPRGWGY